MLATAVALVGASPAAAGTIAENGTITDFDARSTNSVPEPATVALLGLGLLGLALSGRRHVAR